MAQKTNTKKKSTDYSLLQATAGFLLIILAIYILWVVQKGADIRPESLNENLGFLGAFFYRIFGSLMGKGAFWGPVLLVVWGLYLGVPRLGIERRMALSALGFAALSLAWGHLDIALEESLAYGLSGIGGGMIGSLVSFLFLKAFGPTGTKFILVALMLLLIYLGSKGRIFEWLKKLVLAVQTLVNKGRSAIFLEGEPKKKKAHEDKSKKQKLKVNIGTNVQTEPSKKNINNVPVFIDDLKNYQHELLEEEKSNRVKEFVESGKAEEEAMQAFDPKSEGYDLPSLNLLKAPHHQERHYNKKEVDENAHILQQTLEDFGVQGQIDEVSIGPTVTEYEFSPAPGVKVSKILNLADDIALNLATTGIRIQAPIPGKAAVGIEVPNKKTRPVLIREILESSAFQESKSNLTVALGMDISGHPIVTDLSKMPHLLIAGSTGSGKSVCLNALIISILYKAKPYEVKFLMIDPKMVELGNYNGIPHLIAPVVTDSKKAAGTLHWAVKEMERRYDLFAENGVRDIDRFNEKCLEDKANGLAEAYEPLHRIVIIIDELADLMMVAPGEVEDAICRLAQMARACGMHLVIATQRPSVDVITGIIKANIPSRIAFSVTSQVDSRTILDVGGAEKLLGRGDMLFFPTGYAKPKRIQGVFVTDPEIDRVVINIKKQGEPDYNDAVMAIKNAEAEAQSASEGSTDELLGDASRLFVENGQASISMLQRHFRIGYTRAARMIDEMEALGIVGPYEGSKPRQVRMTLHEWESSFGHAKEEA